MERQNRKSQILNILAKSVRRVVEEDIPDFDDLQEIRLRTGKPLIVIYRNREVVLPTERKQHITTKEEIRETMEYISHYSLYAYENELRQGFLTVEGGHRVGVSGKVIVEKDKVKNIQHISSVNIRMSHEVIGCADGLLPYITKNMQVCHTLIISPPRCGKTEACSVPSRIPSRLSLREGCHAQWRTFRGFLHTVCSSSLREQCIV